MVDTIEKEVLPSLDMKRQKQVQKDFIATATAILSKQPCPVVSPGVYLHPDNTER